MGPVLKQADALNAKFALMQKQLAGVNAELLNNVRVSNQERTGFRDAIAGAGAHRAATVKAISATEQFTEALQKQDLTAKQAFKNRKQFNEVLKEQYRLQRMSVMEWSTDARGRISADMFIPKDAPDAMRSFGSIAKATANQTISFGDAANMARMRVGLMSEVVRSAGLNMVNLGKNTQWAGRQMMVGISIPFIALAAGAATLSYQVEKELTRVARVYDTQTTMIKSEQRAVQEESMRTAKAIAGGWGMAAKETLDITAQLAATGETGMKLQQDTAAIAELSIMGELDRQDAIKAAITLNTVFKDSLISLGDSYKYLNKLENETVVSSQDMVTAIPKLAGVVKTLGGDITDIGTLMAAARGAGIEAGEAANTLKSISFRNVAPTDRAIESFQRLTNVDFTELVKQTQGDVIPTIKAIQEAMDGLDQIERVQVLRDLQGLWQGSKAISIFNQFFDPTTGLESEQVRRAKSVGEAGAEAWRETWDQEAQTLQESLPNRFKRAVEAIKFELATMGEPFLEAAIDILGGITKIVKAFNGLGDGTKHAIMFGVAIAAIIGPIVMVSGVFLNLLGTMVKLGGSMGMFISRFKAVNADQRVAALLSKAASGAYLTQAESAIVLSTQLGRVGQQLDAIAGKSAAAKAGLAGAMAMPAGSKLPAKSALVHGAPVGGIYQSRIGQTMAVQNPGARAARTATEQQISRARSMAHTQALIINGQKDLTKYTERHAKALGGTTAGIAGAAGMMGLLVGGTNKWVMYTSMALLMYPLFVPLIAKITASLQLMALTMMKVAGFGAAAAKLGPVFASIASKAGPVGIAVGVIAAGIGLWTYRARKAREEFNKIANAGDSMTEMMGFDPLKAGEWVDENGTKQKNAIALAEEFKQKNKEVAESLGELYRKGQESGGSFEELYQKANEIGLDVYKATGDAKEARKAVQAALISAGAVELALNVQTNFDSKAWVDNIKRDAATAMADSAVELQFRGSLSNDDLESQLKEGAERLAESYGQALSGSIEPKVMIGDWERDARAFTMKMDGVIATFLKNKKTDWNDFEKDLFADAGVDPANIESIRQAFIVNEEFRNGIMMGTTPALADLRMALGGTVDAYRYYSIQVAKQTGLDKNAKVNGYDVAGMARYLSSNFNVLNGTQQSVAASAEGATDAIDGTGGAIEETASEALKAATSLDRLNEAQKQAMTSAWNNVLEFASQQYEDQLQEEMDSIQATGEATAEATENDQKAAEAAADLAREKFEDRWEDTMRKHEDGWEDRIELEKSAYDLRIEGVESAIEAEQEAEKIRQRIFDAEKNRLQRMAELYTQNINFDVALNSGDLDEAARIGVNTAATVGQWAIDDAREGTGAASEKKLEGLEGQKDLINEEKDARIKALEELREAEKRALDDRKKDEDASLKATQDAEQARFEARRKSEEKATEAAERSAQKRHDAAKRALEMDLAALQTFIPRNQQELREHMAEIEATYARHGGVINVKSQEWAEILNSVLKYSAEESRRSLMNDINWAEFGGKAAEDFIRGAFDKSIPEFQAMFGTGAAGLAGGTANVPKNTLASQSAADSATASMKKSIDIALGGHGANVGNVNQNSTGVQRHEGGKVNMSAGSRNGYPKSAQRFPSEVDTRLQVGEYVVKKDAVQKLGLPFMNAVNQGYLPKQPETHHSGGPVGMAGVAGAALSGILQTAMASGIRKMVENSPGAHLAAQQYQGREQFRPVFVPPPAAEGGFTGPYTPGPGLTPPDGFVSWMTPEQRGVHPEVLKRVGSILAQFPGGQRITSGFRRNARVAGSGRTSLHASGRAVDIGMNAYNPQESALGDQIAKAFRTQVPGVSEVLWKTMTGGNHFDHIHVGFRGLHQGGPVESSMTKGLRNGGFTLNEGFAKLHPREAVLSAPLTQQFEQGVSNFANGGSNEYNVTVDLRGAMVRENIDIESAVERALAKANSKIGLKRKIG